MSCNLSPNIPFPPPNPPPLSSSSSSLPPLYQTASCPLLFHVLSAFVCLYLFEFLSASLSTALIYFIMVSTLPHPSLSNTNFFFWRSHLHSSFDEHLPYFLFPPPSLRSSFLLLLLPLLPWRVWLYLASVCLSVFQYVIMFVIFLSVSLSSHSSSHPHTFLIPTVILLPLSPTYSFSPYSHFLPTLVNV